MFVVSVVFQWNNNNLSFNIVNIFVANFFFKKRLTHNETGELSVAHAEGWLISAENPNQLSVQWCSH